jgi:hypothetical protein
MDIAMQDGKLRFVHRLRDAYASAVCLREGGSGNEQTEGRKDQQLNGLGSHVG